MARETTQDQALTIEQYRRLIHELYKVILADGGTKTAPPPETPLEVAVPEVTGSVDTTDDETAADEPIAQRRQRAA